MASIFLEEIGKRFGAATALHEITLEVADGEFLVLLGPSGCGKTTLLRIIAGLIPTSSGRVVIGDRDVTGLPPRQRDVAMVFQSYALYPHLDVARNLGFGLRVRRRPRAEIESRVQSVAEQLQLTQFLKRKPKELSGGQRQRVALGRAMVRDPQIFLMDEPLSNLDAQLRTATRLELITLHRRLGTTFVYVTHDQIEAMTMGTKIAILNQGRLEQIGTPAEVYDEPATTFVAGFIGSPPMNLIDAAAAGQAGQIHIQADGVRLQLWRGELEERAVVLGIRPEDLRLARAGMDEPILEGTVTVVENLGAEEIAICDVGGVQVAVRGPRPIGVWPGDHVGMTAPLDRIHLFDSTSRHRLRWRPDAASGYELSSTTDKEEIAS